jgi:hypothetical protein
MSSPSIVIRQGYEYSSTAYRRTGPGNATVVPIPTGFEAKMIFTPTYDASPVPWTLTSSPPAGLTIDYPDGQIAIYMGATFTASLPLGLRFCWQLQIYDPLNPDAVVFLGNGSGIVSSDSC